MEVEKKTQVVDVDIRALINKVSEENPLENKEPTKTIEDVLRGFSEPEEETEKEKEVVEEKKIEEEEKKEAIVKKPNLIVNNNVYKEKLSSLISDGFLKDNLITVEKNGETQEVYLSELDIDNEDDYKAIIESYKKAEEEELKSKYISVEGLDETTKKLVDLKKQGGDISEIIKEDIQFIDVLQKMKDNIDDEEQQVSIVYHNLKGKGLSDRVIKAQIQDLSENFELDKEAARILDLEIEKHELSIEEKRHAQLELINKEKERQKEFKKEVLSKVKEMKISESLQKILIQNMTVRDENGLTNTDKLYFDTINDPDKHAKVAFMLHNYEEFEKLISQKKVFSEKAKITNSMFKANLGTTKKQAAVNNNSGEVNSLLERLKI